MSKRVLSEGVLDKFFSLFLKAKSQNKESGWLSRLRDKDPELADIWSGWDSDMNKLLAATQAMAKKRNLDTTDIDAVINKYS
jgi:hypothetical protein